METTLTPRPEPESLDAASRATVTSLPVPMMTTSSGRSESASTYPPQATAPQSVVPASTGTSCRVRSRAVGPSASMAAFHAPTVSLASAGRKTSRPGMTRSAATCSTGWWVGPSSPTPTESWLQTKMLRARLRAARRTAPLM